ncbi:hypothetical protein JCM8208_006713 [Rhodotorula glutinis]
MAKRRRDDHDYAPKAASARSNRAASPRARSKGASPRPAVPGRGTVACLQCRTRKSVCSLTGPACDGCQLRGETDNCSFQALLWIDNPEDLPSRQLKRKLDRLEELMALVSADSAPSIASTSPAPPERPRASSAPVTGPPALLVPVTVDGAARDRAADTLMRHILGGSNVPDLGALDLDSASLSAYLRQIDLEEAPPLPYYNLPTPASLHASITPEEYERTVTAVAPTLAQAQLSLSAFFATANGLFRLVHPSTFLAQCDTFWRTHAAPEPAWLATYLVACGLGLMLSPDPSVGKENVVVPSGAAKELLARTWVDAGRRVLAAIDALVQPTVESVRAFSLLLHWWMVEGGRYLEATLSLTGSVVSGLFDLQLHRDPREVAPHLSPVEANLRRRLFWTLYSYECVARPMLGKAWQPFDEDEISVDFPVDSIGGEPDASEPISTAHAQAGMLNRRVSKALTSRKGTSPDEVSVILDDLDEFLNEHGDNVFVAALARYSYHRLHRFAARACYTSEAQDRLAVQHLGNLFASIDSAGMEDAAAAPYILLRILASAVCTAVDLNGLPVANADASPSRRQLDELLHFVRTRPLVPKVTRMVRRAVVIVEHLVPRSRPCESVPFGPAFTAESMSEFSLASSSELPTPSTAGPAPEGFACAFPDPRAFHHGHHFYGEQLAPPSPPVDAPSQHPAPMGPPSSTASQPFRTSRPALSLFTTVAPPASSAKALTPLTLSPWIDAAVTPSRYAGDFLWNPQF